MRRFHRQPKSNEMFIFIQRIPFKIRSTHHLFNNHGHVSKDAPAATEVVQQAPNVVVVVEVVVDRDHFADVGGEIEHDDVARARAVEVRADGVAAPDAVVVQKEPALDDPATSRIDALDSTHNRAPRLRKKLRVQRRRRHLVELIRRVKVRRSVNLGERLHVVVRDFCEERMRRRERDDARILSVERHPKSAAANVI